MTITLPLDPEATASADAAFYKKYPSMVNSDGSRIPLAPNNPDHAKMIADWRAMYVSASSDDVDDEEQNNTSRKGVEGGKGSEDVPGADHPPDDPCQTCDDEEDEDDKPRVKYRVSFFFDGTGNNRFNVGTAYSDAGESNVSKMEHCCYKGTKDRYTYKSFYVEGIGTEQVTDDNWLSNSVGFGKAEEKVGSGTGMGKRGIVARVEQAIATLLDYVEQLSEPLPVEEFLIDAIGFSRGAAAARYFIWRLNAGLGKAEFEDFNYGSDTIQDRLAASLTMECTAEYKFLGLFDTVSSHGTDHENDVKDLHLDEIDHAKTVVQLAAAEEHRKNFQLTTISKGTEIYLPGVHSDIGGGYANNAREDDWQLLDLDELWLGKEEMNKLKDDRNWFIERGWFTEEELPELNFYRRFTRELVGSRGPITNYYSRIPLKIMLNKFKETDAQFFDNILKWVSHTLDGISDSEDRAFLKDVEEKILGEIESSKCRSYRHWLDNTEDDWHKSLRHKHLHISARYGEMWYAHVPNWVPDDPVKGTRKRGTNAG